MGFMLIVYDSAVLGSAVKAAGRFLNYHRRRVGTSRTTDEILGIWLRRGLETGLPAWPCFRHKQKGEGVRLIRAEGASSAASATATTVGVLESFAFSASWSLCLFDGPLLYAARNAEERRLSILDVLVKETDASDPAGCTPTFHPVFDAKKSLCSIEASMRILRAAHPDIRVGTWFTDNSEQGRLCPTGAS